MFFFFPSLPSDPDPLVIFRSTQIYRGGSEALGQGLEKEEKKRGKKGNPDQPR